MFDPYHKWLGIPPVEQPPDHYRLLGLARFEADREVIDAAANRQMAYLQGCATGPHVLLSQRLLNEVAAARLTLLSADRKARYDANLMLRSGDEPPAVIVSTVAPVRTRRPEPVPAPRPPLIQLDDVPDEVWHSETQFALNLQSSRSRTHELSRRWLTTILAGSIAVIALGLGVWLRARPAQPPPAVIAPPIPRIVVIPPGPKSEPKRVEIEPITRPPTRPAAGPKVGPAAEPKVANRETARDVPSVPEVNQEYLEHVTDASCVAFTPDGRFALTGGKDGRIRIWGFPTGQLVRTLVGHNFAVNNLIVTRDQHRVASCGADSTIRIWEFETGEEIRVLRGHKTWINWILFSQDEKYLLSSTGHSGDKGIRIWDIDSGLEVKTILHDGPLALSPGGSKLFVGEYQVPLLLDWRTGAVQLRVSGHRSFVQAVAYAPNGNSAASASGWLWTERGFSAGSDNSIRLWDLRNGKELRRFVGHRDWVNCIAFTPDGKRLLSGGGGTIEGVNNWKRGSDWSVRLWNVATGSEVRRFDGHTSPVKHIAMARGGKAAISSEEGGKIIVWNLPD